jgi:enterochelin esterase-like enzyme
MGLERRPTAFLAGFVVVAALLLAAIAVTEPAPLGPQPTTSRIKVQSESLSGSMRVEWYLAGPPGSHPDRLLVLLHGRGGDEPSWFAGSFGDGIGVAAIADRLVAAGQIPPVLLASVLIDDSYGVDSPPADDGYDHGAYGTFLAADLWPELERQLPLANGPVRRYVAGYSMGGFAALHLVLRDPGAFAGVGALSTAAFLDPPADRLWEFDGDRAANDPVALAATADVAGLRAFLGAASRDGAFLDASHAISARLQDRGAVVADEVVGGGHDVTTWRTLTPDMLRWLLGTNG